MRRARITGKQPTTETALERRARVAAQDEHAVALNVRVLPPDSDAVGGVLAGQPPRQRGERARMHVLEADEADAGDRRAVDGRDLEAPGHERTNDPGVDAEIHQESAANDSVDRRHWGSVHSCYLAVASIELVDRDCQGRGAGLASASDRSTDPRRRHRDRRRARAALRLWQPGRRSHRGHLPVGQRRARGHAAEHARRARAGGPSGCRGGRGPCRAAPAGARDHAGDARPARTGLCRAAGAVGAAVRRDSRRT